MAHEWSETLNTLIAREYGEPEKAGEHCEVAANAVFAYMENRCYVEEDMTDGTLDAYELYQFARFLHGRFGAAAMGDCNATAIEDHIWT